jgi:DNA-directed RNA polymerase subunit RPC12/RpoP
VANPEADHRGLPRWERIVLVITNMPKLACPCGYIHNLSGIPDDGWRAIRDRDLEDYLEQYRLYSDGFNASQDSPEKEASNIGGRETVRMQTLLYECPQCGRIMWRKGRDEEFHIYLPESEVWRTRALVLAVAADYEREQQVVRAEAIRVHNQAARIVAQRMAKDGLRCPHCLEFSRQMQFIERQPEAWSFFQCPSCSRTFRLEKFGEIKE